MMRTSLVSLSLLLVGFSGACSRQEFGAAMTEAQALGVFQAEYEKIQVGMTVDQVEAIISTMKGAAAHTASKRAAETDESGARSVLSMTFSAEQPPVEVVVSFEENLVSGKQKKGF
ncbi:MAG: hypothetical protein VYE77_08495 [Planctomycetota bacterium]|nr:hypothetical protein [Planctomycetota bacterium]